MALWEGFQRWLSLKGGSIDGSSCSVRLLAGFAFAFAFPFAFGFGPPFPFAFAFALAVSAFGVSAMVSAQGTWLSSRHGITVVFDVNRRRCGWESAMVSACWVPGESATVSAIGGEGIVNWDWRNWCMDGARIYPQSSHRGLLVFSQHVRNLLIHVRNRAVK